MLVIHFILDEETDNICDPKQNILFEAVCRNMLVSVATGPLGHGTKKNETNLIY